MKFSSLAEHQIRKAQTEGQFDNLCGAGKPLPASGASDHAEAAGFRIMAEVGALPREVVLRKAVAAQTEALAAAIDPKSRAAALRRLGELQMALSIQEEARRRFYRD